MRAITVRDRDAGGVGSIAVQLAREAGARVIGTGRAGDREVALGLGARTFSELDADDLRHAGEVDVVFDVRPPPPHARQDDLRGLLARRGVTFQRTKTWKESPDPDREAKLDRIEEDFDRFPDRVPATYHRTHGVRYFHGCYSVGDDRLWGVNHCRKGAVNTLAALKSIRAARPDGAPIYVIMDNLSAHKGARIRSEKGIRWGGRPLAAAA